MARRFLPLLFLLLGAGGLAALAITRPAPQPLVAEEKEWVVQVEPAMPRTLNPTLTLFARVDSPRAATLTAAVGADVVTVPAREGDDTAAGALLVELDDRDARLLLAQREADVAELRAEIDNERQRYENDVSSLTHEQRLLELAQRDVERSQRLATRDLGSAARLDESLQALARQALTVDSRRLAIAGHESRTAMLEARLARAEALAAQGRLEIERTEVRAPFDARISAVSVAPGDRVRPGDPLVSLFDAASLELRAQVPTRYLGTLRRSLDDGRDVVARATADGTTVTARLDRLGARVERGRGGADALFVVAGDSQRARLELGRTLELRVTLPAVDEVVPIPAEALYGTDRIYVLEDSRMRGMQVERLGEQRDERGETRLLVRSDALTHGTPVIVTHLPNAVDGLRVRTVQ